MNLLGKKKATRSQKINVMEREGGCTMFLLPAAWATWCPKHPSCTMDFAKPQCEAHSPMGQLSPSPSIGPGGQIWHSLPGTGCKHNFTDFGSPPRAGQTYPRVLERKAGAGTRCPAPQRAAAGQDGTRGRGRWGLCGHQHCEDVLGGQWQLGAAQGCCGGGGCLQWPFKPDWKMLCIARLTKKRH